jgi:integrase/recombinase XerD
MLAPLAKSYIALRRACGFAFVSPGSLLESFAAFSDAQGKSLLCAKTAIDWAGQGRSVHTRARRLGYVIRFARHLRAEDPRHELPLPVFGSEKGRRPVPYILSEEQIRHLIQAATISEYRPFCGQTYSTLFALLACTGLRVSEAINLRFKDITADGLIIRNSKYKKSRMIPLHETTQAGLARYLEQRRPYAPFDDHVFISMRRKPLRRGAVLWAFDMAARKIGLPREPRRRRASPHSLRHTFVTRALHTCPDSRDRIASHTMALSTYMGHATVANTYYYMEATGPLMKQIAERSENFLQGVRRS